jgi:hypothetical protein
MADTLTAKIQVRNGDISELPILSEAELAYATDQTRLFIGNIEYNIGTGNGVLTTFNIPSTSNIPIPATNVEYIKFFVDGIERNDVTVGGTTVTFSVAPVNASVITMKYNSEINLINSSVNPNSLLLSASVTVDFQDTGFAIDSSIYDTVFINYSIKMLDGSQNLTGYRIGTIKAIVDLDGDDFILDDSYTSFNNDNSVLFSGRIQNNIFYLTYKNSATSTATLKYKFETWKM